MTMKLNKKSTSTHLFSMAGLMTLIFLFSVSCGPGEEVIPELPEEEIPLIQEKVEELETELAEKDETIAELEHQKSRLETQIPEPREVMPGDSHWGIAYDYLTQEQGLSSQEAREYLSEALLFHPILVGFRVWNYFNEGIFGSFVTQGTADISPGAVMRAQKKETAETKEELQNRIDNLESQKQDLSGKLDQMQKQYADETSRFQNQIDNLEGELEESRGDIRELESALNSVYYLAGTESDLKQRGTIKGTFLGICGKRAGEVTFADFTNKADLDQVDRITLDAGDFGLNRIGKVGVLPKHFQEGQDYRIEYSAGGQTADLLLLNKDKFRLARLIIFVG